MTNPRKNRGTGNTDFEAQRATHDRVFKKEKVYISGPMTGIKDFNFPAFNKVADKLRAEGYEVLNPAEHGTGEDWDYYMRKDIKMVADCDMVVVLEGWSKSRGAKIEVFLAAQLGIPIFNTYSLTPIKTGWRFDFIGN